VQELNFLEVRRKSTVMFSHKNNSLGLTKDPTSITKVQGFSVKFGRLSLFIIATTIAPIKQQ
jgi:hypothetical protein